MDALTRFVDDLHFNNTERGKEDTIIENGFINEAYDVFGWVYNQATKSTLKFKQEFPDKERATDFFEKMKESYPLSIIKMYKNTWQEQRVYS